MKKLTTEISRIESQKDELANHIEAEKHKIRKRVGRLKLSLINISSQLLSRHRTLKTKPNVNSNPMYLEQQQSLLPEWPRLRVKKFYDPGEIKGLQELLDCHAAIAQELDMVLNSFSKSDYDDVRNSAPWEVFYFEVNGQIIEANKARCPNTSGALAKLDTNLFHVCFSRQKANSALEVHTGPSNAGLTIQIGLKNCEQTFLWVGGESRKLELGKALVFDDTFPHFSINEGDQDRYSLMVTVHHPDLSLIERRAIEYFASTNW